MTRLSSTSKSCSPGPGSLQLTVGHDPLAALAALAALGALAFTQAIAEREEPGEIPLAEIGDG